MDQGQKNRYRTDANMSCIEDYAINCRATVIRGTLASRTAVFVRVLVCNSQPLDGIGGIPIEKYAKEL